MSCSTYNNANKVLVPCIEKKKILSFKMPQRPQPRHEGSQLGAYLTPLLDEQVDACVTSPSHNCF